MTIYNPASSATTIAILTETVQFVTIVQRTFVVAAFNIEINIIMIITYYIIA